MGYQADITACTDLTHYEMVAKIMANELATMELASDPLDVAETIENLSEEMERMPEIITDCRQAVETLNQLDLALDRMYSLADRAAESDEGESELRQRLNEEFAGYAHIVARVAGADNFEGPFLSLETRADARVCLQVLGCLGGARHDFTKRLQDQRRRINAAMDDALNVLATILRDAEHISYATRDGLTELVGHLRNLSDEYLENSADLKPRGIPIWLN
jgi:hypothetical protein